MTQGGISKRLINFSKTLVGPLPGGLAMVVILASMFFSALTGTAIAAAAAIGGMMIPAMDKKAMTNASLPVLLQHLQQSVPLFHQVSC